MGNQPKPAVAGAGEPHGRNPLVMGRIQSVEINPLKGHFQALARQLTPPAFGEKNE